MTVLVSYQPYPDERKYEWLTPLVQAEEKAIAESMEFISNHPQISAITMKFEKVGADNLVHPVLLKICFVGRRNENGKWLLELDDVETGVDYIGRIAIPPFNCYFP